MALLNSQEIVDFSAGLLVIVQLVLTACVAALGRDWNGFKRSANLNRHARLTAHLVSTALLLVVIANASLIIYRLVRAPADLGNKDELSLTAAALGVLWWTDILRMRPSVRRRRRIADLLALFPTFRFGSSGYNSPTSAIHSDAEFVIRSARWSLNIDAMNRYDNVQNYWRGKIARAYESSHVREGAGGSIIVLFDDTTQDEAGADLLTPEFTHVPHLSKRQIADVVWSAVARSRMSNIDHYSEGFSTALRNALTENRRVHGMLNGELSNTLFNVGTSISSMDDESFEFCRVVWAKVLIEVLDYLATGTEMVLLKAIADVPISITSPDWDPTLVIEACSITPKTGPNWFKG